MQKLQESKSEDSLSLEAVTQVGLSKCVNYQNHIGIYILSTQSNPIVTRVVVFSVLG